jgi:hypothetical protein
METSAQADHGRFDPTDVLPQGQERSAVSPMQPRGQRQRPDARFRIAR